MNHYETVYIIHPAIQEGRLNDIITKVHNKISKLKGEILYIENWGKKKLAYAIDKQKYGTYIMCQYTLDGQAVKEISEELELNSNILRYLISKIDSSDVKEGSNKLSMPEANDVSKSDASKSDVKEEQNEESATSDAAEEQNKESAASDAVEEQNKESATSDAAEEQNEELAASSAVEEQNEESATSDTVEEQNEESATSDDDK